MGGDGERACLKRRIGDHDRARFEERKALLAELARLLNAKYGAGAVAVDCRDVYYNMHEKIAPVMQIVRLAEQAVRAGGVGAASRPRRRRADGAGVCVRGVPRPNLFTGGHNFHGRYEYLPLRSLQKAAETVLGIIRLAGQKMA